MSTVDELTIVICAALDNYRLSQRPRLMVGEVLAALERIRHGMTEKLVRQKQKS